MPTWNADLAVGVPDIDAQHQELFRRADALLAAMRERQPADREVERLFCFLDEYCSRHFASEERLMRERKYPELGHHAAQHADFVRTFQTAVERFRARGPSVTVTIAIQQLVSGWLVRHIGAVDAKLARFLAGQSFSMTL